MLYKRYSAPHNYISLRVNSSKINTPAMAQFYKKMSSGFLHSRLIFLKRLWNMKPRSMKPALMVLIFLVISLVLNSLFIVGTKGPQELKGEILDFSDPLLQQHKFQPTVHPSKLASQKLHSASQELDLSHDTERKNERFSAEMKRHEITESFVPKEWVEMKKNERLYESGYRNDDPYAQAAKKYSESKNKSESNVQELSFGFVNKDFKQPDLSQTNLADLMGRLGNTAKMKTGLNPGSVIGSVIGAVVGVKKYMSKDGPPNGLETDAHMNPYSAVKQSPTDTNGENEQNNINMKISESSVLHPETKLESNSVNSHASGLDDKNRSDNARNFETEKVENMPQKNSKGLLEDTNNLGTLVSKYGPSLFSLAFSTDSKTQSDSFNDNPVMSLIGSLGPILLSQSLGKGESNANSKNSNPISSIISNIGSTLISNGMSQVQEKNESGSQGSHGRQNTNLLNSIVNDVGPVLMANLFGSGLSSNTQDARSTNFSERKSPLQSVMSGLGSNLMGGIVQNMLSNSNHGLDSNSSPVQSVISGLAPVLLAGALGQGHSPEGRSNSRASTGDRTSPLLSLVNGLGPAVLKAVGQGLGGELSKTDSAKKTSSLGSIISNVVPVLLADAATKPKDKSNNMRNYPNSSPHEAVREKTPSKNETMRSNTRYEEPNYVTRDNEGQNLPDFSVNGWLLKSAAKVAVGSLLPDHFQIPDVNSKTGFWDMAVNVALGNPREENGRKGVFWNWLREYGGMENKADDNWPTSWITESLSNPNRSQYITELKNLHAAITKALPICEQVRMIGGVFNWKRNQMEDERAICFDNDVSPMTSKCIIYSFGLKSQWAFEEAMEKIGCQVYVFDPNEESGNHNHTRNIHFYNVGISDIDTTKKVNGQILQLFTLSKILGHFGHETTPISYMRLRLGKDEWKALQHAIENTPQSLTNTKQLSIEVDLGQALEDPSLYKRYLEVLKALESLGFQLFFSKSIQSQENVVFLDPFLDKEVSLGYQMVFIRI